MQKACDILNISGSIYDDIGRTYLMVWQNNPTRIQSVGWFWEASRMAKNGDEINFV